MVINSPSSLDLPLKKAFLSYRQGLLRQPVLSLPPRNLSTISFLSTVEVLSLKERAKLHRLSTACTAGLTAARLDQLEIASEHFKNATAHLEVMVEGSRLAWLLGVSTYQAGIAYLYFKNGSCEESLRRLNLAMNADLELELSGLLFMQVRRIQHGHNLARMDFSMNKRSAAINLVGELVAYMEGRIGKLSYHYDWRPRLLQEVPKDMLRFLIREVVGETVGRIVTGGSSKEEWRTLIGTARLDQSPDSTIFPQAQYALLAQSQRLLDKPEGYLHNLNCFFRAGIRHCHLLWYAVMVDFANFCKELNTSCSQQIRELIKRDSSKWKGFPSFLAPPLTGADMYNARES